MCGINGFTWRDENLIKKMNKKIIHRGPDSEKFFLDNSISLGHVRLSVIDLDDRSSQPMKSICGNFVIVFNGEIYNYKELRNELINLGYSFKTLSDTEVILNSYIEWGNNCHNKFNGMWAFTIYDKKNNKVIFSRDRFGIKPFYYYQDSNGIIFSSEIKGILEYNLYNREVNEDLLMKYLLYNRDTDLKETFFKGIFKLPNSSYGIYDLNNKNFNIVKYWDLDISEELGNKKKFDERKKMVRDAFIKSLKFHNISDVDVGSCLSGGIDSSSIVCCMNNIYNGNKVIKTFSAVFKGETVDESNFIDIVLKKTNSKSFRVTPKGNELINDIEDLIITQEEPFVGTSVYNQYRVMKLVKESGIKVTLDGQGGDEVFGGYYSFYPYYILNYIKKISLFKLIKLLIGMKKYYSPNIFKALINPLLALVYIILPSKLKIIRAKKNFGLLSKKYISYKYYPINKVGLNLNKWYYYEQMEIIQNLLRYADKNSMRWGIESRVPFLEKELVELVGKLPFEDKVFNGLPKYILRESMNGILPEKIKNRYDKKGFEIPEEKLLRTPEMKKKIFNIFSEENLFISKYIDINKFNVFLNNFYNGTNNNYKKLWKLLNLEIWGKIYIQKK